MDNVKDEIVQAVELITTASTPEVQLAAIHKFFASDAGFNHPLCCVPRAPGSREQLLGIYQWYREMSPNIKLSVDSHSWDEENMVVWLNVTQTFQIWFSPLKAGATHLVVRLSIVQDPKTAKFLIAQQDDFYQPEDLATIFTHRLVPVIYLGKRAGTLVSNLNAWVFQNVFGWWKPTSTVGTRKA